MSNPNQQELLPTPFVIRLGGVTRNHLGVGATAGASIATAVEPIQGEGYRHDPYVSEYYRSRGRIITAVARLHPVKIDEVTVDGKTHDIFGNKILTHTLISDVLYLVHKIDGINQSPTDRIDQYQAGNGFSEFAVAFHSLDVAYDTVEARPESITNFPTTPAEVRSAEVNLLLGAAWQHLLDVSLAQFIEDTRDRRGAGV